MSAPGASRLFHRFPFVLTDRGLDSRPDGSSACRLISIDDALGEGVLESSSGQSLLVEAMAQTAALFAEGSDQKQSGMLVGLRGIRFGRPPRTADRLLVEASLTQKFGDLLRVSAVVKSADEVLAEGEILISLSAGDGPSAPPHEESPS